MSGILEEIVTYKREFVLTRRREQSIADLRLRAKDTPTPIDFFGALVSEDLSLIAEIKKASPSKGLIRSDFDPEYITDVYEKNGATCLSVLTDEQYFQGSDVYLRQARAITGLPILRKDFTVDEYQLHEARVLGADAVLLIVSLMDGSQLDDYIGLANELHLTALTEVHDLNEIERASSAGARLIGINNRDLKTFNTTLETTFELLNHRPADTIMVSESGINCRRDVERLESSGIDAILVGESLMRECDIGSKMRELLGR